MDELEKTQSQRVGAPSAHWWPEHPSTGPSSQNILLPIVCPWNWGRVSKGTPAVLALVVTPRKSGHHMETS